MAEPEVANPFEETYKEFTSTVPSPVISTISGMT